MKWGIAREKLSQAAESFRRVVCLLAPAQAARLGRALLQSDGVISLLRLVIVVELCVLGVGVVRRLEDSYERAYEASRLELAVLDAQALAREHKPGAALIGVDAQETDEPGEAPALRPRDLATIISDETGDYDMAASLMGDDSFQGNADAQTAHDPQEAAMNKDDDDEVDALIRKGVAALIAGDMRLCVLSLEQAAAMAPNHPAMLYYYGMAYDKLLNPQKARDYYKRLFQMREQAGIYFERAARRLTYGVEQPAALRGKLAFGPHKLQHTYDPELGEQVSLLLPIMLAPGEDVRSDEIYVHVLIFDLVNGRKIDFSREDPKAEWVHHVQNWENNEEDILVTYTVPPADAGGLSTGGDVKYYGFVAKMYYKGEPMDCISVPSSLILHEQQLNSRNRGWDPSGLLPDDGLDPYSEQAVPYSEGYDESAEEIL